MTICDVQHNDYDLIIMDSDKKWYNLTEITCKMLCKILCFSKHVVPKSINYYKDLFDLSDMDARCMFLLPRNCICLNSIIDFQFKILHRFLPTNSLLVKMKKISSNKCTFCMMYKETIEHLFYECLYVNDLWLFIVRWLSRYDIQFELTSKNVLIGYDLHKNTNMHTIINRIIMYIKWFIWKCRLEKSIPTGLNCTFWIAKYCEIERNFECVLHKHYNNE